MGFKIEEILKYTFINKELLDEAINLNCNLIELGNNLINYHINLKMNKEFMYNNNGIIESYIPIDTLNKLKNKLKSNDFFNSTIIKFKLNDVIDDPTQNHDFLKALFGALALDLNNQDRLHELVDNILNLDETIILNLDIEKNYPQLVYEWDKRKNKEVPKYKIIDNNEIINAEVYINSTNMTFSGSAKTKIMAAFNAFKNAYDYLEKNDLLLKITDFVTFPDKENCVNQLQELYLKGFISEPIYKIGLKGSKGGVDIWKCRILIEGIKESFSSEDTSKKDAKRQAAFQMVEYILSHNK